MSEFEREDRYAIIKYSDLDETQGNALEELLRWVPRREAVVVESDWEIYDEVWEMVEAGWADSCQ